jgi:hypothetical protein
MPKICAKFTDIFSSGKYARTRAFNHGSRLAPERSEAGRKLAARISGPARTFFKPTLAEEYETWLTFACNASSTEMNVL